MFCQLPQSLFVHFVVLVVGGGVEIESVCIILDDWPQTLYVDQVLRTEDNSFHYLRKF